MEDRSNKSLMRWILAPITPIILGTYLIGELLILAVPLVVVAAIPVLALSRIRESEADYIGMLLMAQAGFNPNGAVTFWQAMNRIVEEQRKSRPRARTKATFLSTHPHVSRT